MNIFKNSTVMMMISHPEWSSGSVLATDTKIVGGFLRVIKISSTTSFRGEVMPLVSCHRLQHVKESYEREKRCFVGKIQWPHFFTCVSPALLLDDSGGKSYQSTLADESGLI
jgi:hypothetical protein